MRTSERKSLLWAALFMFKLCIWTVYSLRSFDVISLHWDILRIHGILTEENTIILDYILCNSTMHYANSDILLASCNGRKFDTLQILENKQNSYRLHSGFQRFIFSRFNAPARVSLMRLRGWRSGPKCARRQQLSKIVFTYNTKTLIIAHWINVSKHEHVII